MYTPVKEENNVYPCKHKFYYTKVGCRGVCIIQTCLHDAIKVVLSGNPEDKASRGVPEMYSVRKYSFRK